MLIRMKKAQSTAEYAILFGVIIGAAIAMQAYVKKSINARMKDSSDALTSISGNIVGGLEGVSGGDLKTTWQYTPYYLKSGSKVTTNKELSEDKVAPGGEAFSKYEKEYDVETREITLSEEDVQEEVNRANE